MTVPRTRLDLPRAARLGGREAVSDLFRRGERIRRGLLLARYVVLSTSESAGVRAAFLVRRGKWSKPVRNRLRRLIREAYRHHRGAFEQRLSAYGLSVNVAFIWTGTDADATRPGFEAITRSMLPLLTTISRRLRPDPNASDDGR